MITAVLPSLGVDMIQPGVTVVTNLAIGMLTSPSDRFLFNLRQHAGGRQPQNAAFFSRLAENKLKSLQ